MNLNRRNFIRYAACSTVAVPVLTGGLAHAGGHLPKLDEANPQAVALGYKHDSTAVDGAKYPKHEASQICSGCTLYQGKEGNEWGPCGIFPGTEVMAKGWCSAYVPKA